jgi:hypothetical protein
VSRHRLLLCVVLVYFTVDLSLTMMPEVYESDIFLEGTQTARTLASGGGVDRPEPAVEPPVPRPVPTAAPDVAQAGRLALPRPSAPLHRPRAVLPRAPLASEDPH